jgi:tripartite-type tricarboxylate transporter receptor subunit TctC
MANVKAGKLNAIAVTSKERSPLLPNVPTIAESGFPGYDMDTWIAMFVPRQTPDAVVDILYKATMEAVKAPDVQDRITSQAGIVRTGTPAQLDALVKTEIAQFTKIVKDSNIKPE